MVKLPILLNNFNTGLVSEEVLGRCDTSWYLSALKQAHNCVITKYGSVKKRKGTAMKKKIAVAAYDVAVGAYTPYGGIFEYDLFQERFKKSDGDLIILVKKILYFNDSLNTYIAAIRLNFLKDGELIVDSNGVAVEIELKTYLYYVQIEHISMVQKNDVVYMAITFNDPNGTNRHTEMFKIIHNADDDWVANEITLNAEYVFAYGNGVAARVEGYIPLMLIQGKTLTIKYTIAGTEYSATTADTTGVQALSGTGLVDSYVDYDTGKVVIKAEHDTVSEYYYWQAGASIPVGQIIQASNGFIFKCTTGGTTGTAEPDWNVTVGSTVTDNTVTWTCIMTPFQSGTKVYAVLDGTVLNGKVLAFYENRLVVANFKGYEQAFAASVIGNYELFSFGVNDNNSYLYEISSEYYNEIYWVKSKSGLIFGTASGIYWAYGKITPTQVNITKQTSTGSANIDAVFLGSDLLYVSNLDNHLHRLAYDYQAQGYVSSDLCLLAPDVLSAGVKRMEVESSPHSRIWCLLNDGSVAILTYYGGENIYAWQTMKLDVNILDVCSYSTNCPDTVCTKFSFITDRHYSLTDALNGQSFYSVEVYSYYDDDFTGKAYLDGAVYMHSDTPTTTYNVPLNLYDPNTTFSVVTKEGVHPDVTSDQYGTITLNWETTDVVVGSKYDYLVNTVDVEIDKPGELVTVGLKKSVTEMCVDLFESLGGEIEVYGNYQLFFRTALDPMGQLPPLYSGCRKISQVHINEVDRVSFGIKHSDPLPFCLRGIKFNLNVGAV